MAEGKKSYGQSLNLPKTEFPIRPKLSDIQSNAIKAWAECGMYDKKAFNGSSSAKKFVLHDGPPYANGQIHMGHVLNKVLKDVVTRFKRKSGFNVSFRPGWDCHGLPIELKLIKKLGLDPRNVDAIDKVKFKGECRKFAQEWIESQSNDFKRIGVMAEFQNPYSTMSCEYQASIIEVFAKFYEKGLISRREKSVPWCFHCKTTLASAEIEYKDRQDPSCFVLFKITKENEFSEDLKSLVKGDFATGNAEFNVLVWTTTPWTLPFNRALVVHPGTKYAIAKYDQDKFLIVGQTLVEKVASTTGKSLEVCGVIDGKDLVGQEVLHPTHPMSVKIVQDSEVSLDGGTAVVHCAPGCGLEDYLIGVREGLEVACYVDAAGRYTREIGIDSLVGLSVVQGNQVLMSMLEEKGQVFYHGNLTHSYPHCWRCKNGLIFRATRQWFCSLESSKIKQKALESLDQINFIPRWGKNRLEAFVQTRTEWCISRQRIWGVPIPALVCSGCDKEYVDGKLIEFAILNIAKEGIEFWDRLEVKDIPVEIPKDACSCSVSNWRLERDILDVWFDSGSSNWAVLVKDGNFPADLYLEGSDQHRGWFQTSLFCSLVANETVQAKTILTHGYIVDETKNKLSKSSGAQSAMELLDVHGADTLRFWACSIDYQKDVTLSPTALENAGQAYKKIRNTLRFALSNLFDWSVELEEDKVNMTMLDFIAVFKLKSVVEKCLTAYQNYDFTTVFTTILNFCNTDLSAGYYDSLKDRLYTLAQGDNYRRSGQKTLSLILNYVNNVIAPMAPFLAHEVEQASLPWSPKPNEMVVISEFPDISNLDAIIQKALVKLNDATTLKALVGKFEPKEVVELFEELKAGVCRVIEELRQKGVVKGSLETSVKIILNHSNENAKILSSALFAIDQSFEKGNRFLEDFLIVSKVQVDKSDSIGYWFQASAESVALSEGFAKCERCWRWTNDHCQQDPLCKRCLDVLGVVV